LGERSMRLRYVGENPIFSSMVAFIRSEYKKQGMDINVYWNLFEIEVPHRIEVLGRTLPDPDLWVEAGDL